VIIDWLTKEGNYNCWNGGEKQYCMTKVVLRNHQRQWNYSGQAGVGYTYQDQSSGAEVPGRNRLAEPDRGWCDL